MYRLFFKLVLQRIDAEHAHALAKRALRIARSTPVGRAIIRWWVGSIDKCLEIRALGLTFPTPIGVAAGVDKDATWFDDLAALGFGFVEVGTITALPQAGNPPPRVTRLIRDRAILNRMGFPNPGAEVASAQLGRRTPGTIVGVNVGKSKLASVETIGSDYKAAVRHLAPVSDYLVLNVSSPNTPGLRDLQDEDRLRSLVADVRDEPEARCVPLFIKIDPDLDDEHVAAIARLAVELGLDGIVAVNTTVDRSSLANSSALDTPFRGGGISGQPLRARATEVLRCIRRAAGDELVLISVGGVETADDVWQRLVAGATLVQVHTAFIYEGPSWPKRINHELAQKVREAGISSIQEIVGARERTVLDGDHFLNGAQAAVGAGALRGSAE